MMRQWSNVTLVNKLVIAFVILIVAQLVSLAVMNRFLERAESMIEREQHQEEVIEVLDGLFAERLGSYFFLFNKPNVTNSTLEANLRKNLLRSSENLHRARALVGENDIASLNVIDSIEQMYREEERTKKEIQSSQYDLQKFGRAAAVLMKLKRLREQMTVPMQTRAEARAERLAAQRQLRMSLFAGIFINVVIASFILITLIRRMRAAVAALKANADSMQLMKELPYTVNSNDELGLLDQTLHSAHANLVSARQHKDAFNQMIAHDIRSPIMSVELLLQSINDNEADSGLQHKISTLRSNVRRIYNHVEDLLSVEKLDSGRVELHFSEFDIQSLIEQIRSESIEMARRRGLEICTETQSCVIIADYERICQVLTNYVSNAIKFADANSTIDISSENSAQEVCVKVANSGPAISKADQSRLFERFFRAPKTRHIPGFGIGLTTCKTIVELHGGSLGMSSDERKTVFWFKLPIE